LSVFWNRDTFTGKSIISAIHPSLPFKVTEDVEWHKRDFSSEAKEIDLTRSPIDQIWDLMLTVPVRAKRNTDVDANSVTVGSFKTVDSYMTCGSSATRSMYTYAQFGAEDCIDVVNGYNVARSFSVSDSHNISDCEFVFSSHRCLKSAFLFDCRDCEFCFGATNKRHKKFIWFNEELSEEEWRKRRAEVDLGCRSIVDGWLEKFYELWKRDGVWPAFFSIGNENCEGEHIFESVRCRESFWMEKCVDCLRARFCLECNDCFYCSGCGWLTHNYMSVGNDNCADNKFTMSCKNCTGLEYCVMCDECQNCFGCVGLNKKQYHIFNKKYSQEEYWQKVDELKCRMLADESYGEFFPGKFSLSGFKYSAGAVYYNYRERDLNRFGAIHVDASEGLVLAPKREDVHVVRLNVDDLPDCVDEVKSDVVNSPINDEELGRDFSITQKELNIYQAQRWPLPRRHFIARLTRLLRHANSPFPKNISCGRCRQTTRTYKNFVFEDDRNVYCMRCYNSFIEIGG
jgi:hypothetical protein